MYNITFQQIEAFLTVAKYLNMSRAAESMYISQPTLSKALQRFETGIGFEVFKRSNHGMTLTTQGEYLYNAMDSLYNGMKRAIDEAKAIELSKKKVLRIIAPSTFDVADDFNSIREIIARYKEKYPDVSVTESLFDFDEQRRQIEFGTYDIIVAHSFTLYNLENIKFKRVNRCSMYIALSAKNPLAKSKDIPYDKLSDLVAYGEPSGAYSEEFVEVVRRNFEKLGITPKDIMPVKNYVTLVHTIINDDGFALCGKLSEAQSGQIKYYELSEEEQNKMGAYLDIAWFPDKLTKPAKDFVKLLQ